MERRPSWAVRCAKVRNCYAALMTLHMIQCENHFSGNFNSQFCPDILQSNPSYSQVYHKKCSFALILKIITTEILSHLHRSTAKCALAIKALRAVQYSRKTCSLVLIAL